MVMTHIHVHAKGQGQRLLSQKLKVETTGDICMEPITLPSLLTWSITRFLCICRPTACFSDSSFGFWRMLFSLRLCSQLNLMTSEQLVNYVQ